MTTPHRAGRALHVTRKIAGTAAMTGVVLSMGALVSMPLSATADVPRTSRATADVATHSQAVSAAAQKKVLAYWTPRRIAAVTEPVTGQRPVKGPDGAPWTRQNHVTKTVGRLFFTDHGEDSSCTATVVASANRSTVATAAHCVNNTNLLGEDNRWATNVMFVPGYHDGRAPYGKYTGRMAVTAATWLKNDQQQEKFGKYDQAFVVLNHGPRGQRLQTAVGAAQKIGFNRPGSARVYQFGYPRAASDPAREGLPEYTGARLAYCTGEAKQALSTADVSITKGLWGTKCVMGGGASGGPRIAALNVRSGLGTVVGVNTEGGYLDRAGNHCGYAPAAGCTRHLIGPQFTKSITEPLYKRAARGF
ncbi:trypsin-like serine peptidase [Streptomyces cadmiisoli]|uniref:trypsin-like serine peptidase n=1 Tax=Streptomyces cadmiisoli TaxID=2184053 RepID=UPI003650912E